MRIMVDSLRNKIELKFEEAAEMLEEMKRETLKKYDNRWEDIFKGLEESAKDLEGRIESYDMAISEITRIRTKSKNANEDLLEFVFNNQTEIEELNEKGQEVKEDVYVQAFDKLSSQINGRLMRSMEVKQMSVFTPLRDYFNEILDIKEQKPKLKIEKKQEKPIEAIHKEKPRTEDPKSVKNQKNLIMEEIKAKLKQYEKLRNDSSEEKDSRRDVLEGIRRQPKPAFDAATHDFKPKYLDLKNTVQRRKQSQDSYNHPLSSDRYQQDYINDIGKYLDDSRQGFKPKPSTQIPTRDHFIPSSKLRNENRAFQVPHIEERSLFGRQERSKYDRGSDHQYNSSGQFKTDYRLSEHQGPEENQKKHSDWYFESMKTINDLKNFRDNVRSKLNIAPAFPSKNQSKFSTPRYGMY